MSRTVAWVVVAWTVLSGVAVGMYALGWLFSAKVLAFVMVGLAVVEAAVVVSMVAAGHAGRRMRARAARAAVGEVLYEDELVAVGAGGIAFHGYGFLTSRVVGWDEVDVVRALRPTLATGRWRVSGTGDFRTWFPSDWRRSRRDTIFLARMKKRGGYDVGFTVRDSRRVREVLKGLGVLHPVCEGCGYDLRATPGRCPECGREAAVAGAP